MSSVAPDAAYAAARSNAIVVDRADRRIIRVWGRDPARMVQGLITNDIDALAHGQSVYAAMLTPKGRMIADLRVIRRTDDLLIECDDAALANVQETFRRFVPPLFARNEDVTADFGVIGVHGPRSAGMIASILSHVPDTDAGEANGAQPSPLANIPTDSGLTAVFRDEDVFVVRTGSAGVDGWEIIVARNAMPALVSALEDAGAVPADLDTLEVLRIEAGHPRWGAELDDSVIPLEAGLRDRAISTGKGCYTGQEVIIRILHRGHVNWRLMGLRLGAAPPPERGTQLFRPQQPKPVARVTSATHSPALGETIALGYVRREVESGEELRLGDADGPAAIVSDLPLVATTSS